MGASPVSFALQVKEEISSLSLPEEALRPLLSGYAKCAGSIRMSSSGNELDLVSESSKVAKLLYGAISSIYGSGVRFAYSKMMGFSKRTRFHVLAKEADYILSDLGVDLLSPSLPKGLLTDNWPLLSARSSTIRSRSRSIAGSPKGGSSGSST